MVSRGVQLEAAAYCLRKDCPWTAHGDPADVDLAARRHSGERGLAGALRPGHSVTMTTTPAGGLPARPS